MTITQLKPTAPSNRAQSTLAAWLVLTEHMDLAPIAQPDKRLVTNHCLLVATASTPLQATALAAPCVKIICQANAWQNARVRSGDAVQWQQTGVQGLQAPVIRAEDFPISLR